MDDDAPVSRRYLKLLYSARAEAHAAAIGTVCRNGLPRNAPKLISDWIEKEDKQILGERTGRKVPTWGQARLCLRSTLRMCLMLLEKSGGVTGRRFREKTA